MTPEQVKLIALGVGVLCVAMLGFYLGGRSAKTELAQARAEWEKERAESYSKHATALADARKREHDAEVRYEEERKRRQTAESGTADALGRLRNQLAATRSRMPTACAAVGTPALDVLGECAGKYREMGVEIGRCDAELKRIYEACKQP